MLLFDDVQRDDPAPAAHLESHFHFLNRVATPFWAAVRHVLDDWFDHVPSDGQIKIWKRFRRPDDRQHIAAFWELYLHELFIRLGFAVVLHPTLPTVTTTPDMLVERDGDSFYIEAVTLTDTDVVHHSTRRRGQVYDAINERVQSANFFLDVETVSEGSGTPPLARIGRTLGRWLATLDPDAVPPYDAARADWALPTYEATFGDWMFRFRALPKRAERRVVDGPTVGMFGPPSPIWVNDHEDLVDRLGRKTRKYGDPDRPLVIALLYERWTARSDHLTRALFGWGSGHPEMIRAGRTEPTWPAEADGLWLMRSGPANRNGSAILCGFHLAPHSIAKTGLHLWHHPWARSPLTVSLPFAAMRVDRASGEILETAATASASELFGLPSVWPPGVPFPKKSKLH